MSLPSNYLVCGHPGTPGPHVGVGNAEVADWWLARTLGALEERAAAAAPANTTDRAKMRMASFMIGNLFWIGLEGELVLPLTQKE